MLLLKRDNRVAGWKLSQLINYGKLSRDGQYSIFCCDHPFMRMSSVYDTLYSSLQVRLEFFQLQI